MKRMLLLLILAVPLIGIAQINHNLAPQFEFAENSLGTSVSGFQPGVNLPDYFRLNAVYNVDFLLFCYERVVPIKEKLGLTFTAGFLIWEPVNFVSEVGLLMGKSKHFGELGLGYHFNPNDSDWNMGILRIGYRYQSKKGFLLKTALAFNEQTFILPLIGVGYAF